MSRALTPELALTLLRELQPDLEAAAVRGGDGELLAGKPLGRDASVVRARSGTVEIAVSPGPFTLPGLAAHDADLAARAVDHPASAP